MSTSTPSASSTVIGSVVIPAHNEAAVIERCLSALLDGFEPGELEVVVACNGCTDETASRASRWEGTVRVLELEDASKPLAVRAAERATSAFPRIYLDADICLPGSTARAMLQTLTSGPVLGTRPQTRYAIDGSSGLVRRYYRARSRMPSLARRLWGAGVYGLSQDGRTRFGEYPDVVADDLFVDRLFAPHEVSVTGGTPAVVTAPRTAQALLTILRRVYRGNAQHRRGSDDRSPDKVASTLGDMCRSLLRQPASISDVVVYVGFVLLARIVSQLGSSVRWERDESSRGDATRTEALRATCPVAEPLAARQPVVIQPVEGPRHDVRSRQATTSRSLPDGANPGPDCGVVVVTYNSADYICRLLDSLPAAAGGLETRVVVVDNASTDATVRLVKAHPDIECIEAGGNLGYAAAINLGRARLKQCSSILVLNPDLWLAPQSILRLYRVLQEPGVGAAVPMLLNEDESLYFSLRREPSLSRAIGDALFGRRFRSRPGWLSETVWNRKSYYGRQSIEWATGAAYLVSAACDERVGDWDDRYFLYSEEVDYASRVRRAGFEMVYTPRAWAVHIGSGSGVSHSLTALLAVNRVRYFESRHGSSTTAMFRAVVLAHHLMRASKDGHRSAARAVARRSRWPQLDPRADGVSRPGHFGESRVELFRSS